MNINPETQAMARNVLDYIREHPEQHDQTNFFAQDEVCGTTMCIAGTAIFIESGVSTNSQFESQFGYASYTQIAGPLLGLETDMEREILFFEMDHETALRRLKYIASGDEVAYTAETPGHEE